MQNTRPPGGNAARSISTSSYIRPKSTRFGPTREYEERRLEGILSIRSVTECPSANRENGRPVSVDEVGESLLVAVLREPTKEVGIGP